MRKIYLTLGCSLALLPAVAQDPQLPNSGFEEPFKDCIPWTSTGNTKAKGTTPEKWTISQVIGMGGVGATQVGEEAEGYESPKAVKVINSPNSVLSTQIVPGYVTLGTTWSTSIMGAKNDGGTFGGLDFTGRPTEITFMYKRELGAEGNTQPATVVVYLWKGTYTQANVPGNIVLGSPTTTDMTNRDRNILDLKTAEGGEVSKSEDAELIGSAIVKITDVTSEWKELKVPIEYLSDAIPEHINVIFAANDYFGDAAKIEAGNSLTIDNVYCVYSEESKPSGEAVEYNGKLTIEMMGSDITDGGMDAKVVITPLSNGKYSFVLPNFTLDLGQGSMNLGDIKLDSVEGVTNEGVTTYTGSVKNFKLYEGMIDADINLNGEVKADGSSVMTIDVLWNNEGSQIPIKCVFTGDKTNAIEDIEIDSANAPVEFYNLNGVRVNGDSLAPGIYIRRQGNDVKKILVR